MQALSQMAMTFSKPESARFKPYVWTGAVYVGGGGSSQHTPGNIIAPAVLCHRFPLYSEEFSHHTALNVSYFNLFSVFFRAAAVRLLYEKHMLSLNFPQLNSPKQLLSTLHNPSVIQRSLCDADACDAVGEKHTQLIKEWGTKTLEHCSTQKQTEQRGESRCKSPLARLAVNVLWMKISHIT